MERHSTAVAPKPRALRRFASVCSVEELILEQEMPLKKTERDVRLLERLLKTKVEDRKMEVTPAIELNEY